jgi:predicted permease
VRRLFNRLRHWIHRRQFDRDLAEELETHRSLRRARLEQGGMTTSDAAVASRRAFGNVTLAREDARAVWIARWVDEFLRDLRHGARLLRRSPGFAVVAVLSLALGIGANTAIFSLVDAIILKPLPVEQPEQLVILGRVNARNEQSNLPYALFDALRTPDRSFAGVLAAVDGTYHLNMQLPESSGDGEPVLVQPVSGEYFQVLGVRTALGRLLAPEDDRLNRPEPVAVMSAAFWRRRFSADRSILGRRLLLKHQSFSIVGVAPADFFGESIGRAPDLWVPLTAQPALDPPSLLNDPRVGWLRVMGRLRPGVTLTEAEDAVNGRLKARRQDSGEFGQSLRQVSRIALEPGSRGLSDTRTKFSQQLWVLMAVVGVVLLVACANLANLLLVRGASRSRETAVRLAIGAGPARLVRQFLTESALLAAIGGSVGLLLARWGSQILLTMASAGGTPIVVDTAPNLRVLTFTLVICLSAVMTFGLAPAAAAARSGVAGALKTSAGHTRLSLTRVLLVVQVGLTLLLLTGAGLLLQTLWNLRTVTLGFSSDEILQVGLNPQSSGYSRDEIPNLHRRLVERLGAMPGVRAVSMSTTAFRTGTSRTCCLVVEGYIPAPGEDREIQTIGVANGYFTAVGVPIVSGRVFEVNDFPGVSGSSAKVAIINQSMARRYFGSDTAVGKRFGWGDPATATYDTEVIGVAGDANYGDLRSAVRPVIYFPSAAVKYLVVRARLPVSSVAASVLRAIHDIDPTLEAEVRTVPQLLDQSLARERMLARLSGFFGAVALLLAGIGLYGLMAYAVTRRTKEIGIRVALGAQRSRVARQLLGESLALVLIGVALGAAAVWMTTRLLAASLFRVTPTDPATLTLGILILVAVTALAAALPARRATLIEPTVALRHE